MGVYQRKNKRGEKRKGWWITYMDGGRQRQESAKTTNKREAERLLAIRRAQVAEGRLRLPSSRPPYFKEFAEDFLKSIPHANTKKRYNSSVNHLKPIFGQLRLSEITPARIEEFKQDRLAAEIRSATVNRDLAVLRRMLNLAERRRLVAFSPMREVEFLEERRQRRLPHVMTFQEQKRLIAVADEHIRVLTVLITETGLRVDKEALALRWADIDFENDALFVSESKTPAGRRPVPLSEYCKEELLRWKGIHGEGYSEFVFPNFRKPALPVKSVRQSWIASLKLAGIPYFPIYNLRATFASRLTAAGVADMQVAHLLGHSTTSIVSTYSKAIDESRREAVRKLEALRAVGFKDQPIESGLAN